jgi:hypothetical protein
MGRVLHPLGDGHEAVGELTGKVRLFSGQLPKVTRSRSRCPESRRQSSSIFKARVPYGLIVPDIDQPE